MHLLRKNIALAAIGVLGMASASQASPIAYEPFNYTFPGNLTSGESPDAGSSGLSGTWNVSSGSAPIQSGNIPSTLTTQSGNSVAIDTGLSILGLSTTSDPSDTSHGTLFLSFLVDLSSLTAGNTQIQFTVSGGAGTGVNVGFVPGHTDFGMNPGGNGYAAATDANAAAVVGTPTLIAVELDYNGAGADTAKLYVNPTSTSATPDLTSASTLTLGSAINQMGLFSSGGGNDPVFDEIRTGTTFGDVISGSATPEPASLTMLGTIGLATLLRRRRARA